VPCEQRVAGSSPKQLAVGQMVRDCEKLRLARRQSSSKIMLNERSPDVRVITDAVTMDDGIYQASGGLGGRGGGTHARNDSSLKVLRT